MIHITDVDGHTVAYEGWLAPDHHPSFMIVVTEDKHIWIPINRIAEIEEFPSESV